MNQQKLKRQNICILIKIHRVQGQILESAKGLFRMEGRKEMYYYLCERFFNILFTTQFIKSKI